MSNCTQEIMSVKRRGGNIKGPKVEQLITTHIDVSKIYVGKVVVGGDLWWLR